MSRRQAPISLLGWALAVAALFLLLLASHGYLPGMINAGAWNALIEGGMRCIDDLGLDALTSSCQALGAPIGFPFMSSGPLVYLGVLFMKVPGVGSYPAYLLSGATFSAVALAGGYGLMRRLGVGPVIALVTASVYLLSPTVLGLRAFGGTFHGFALLPTYMLVDLIAIDALGRRGRRGVALAVGGFAAVRTFALFLDGYSFVAAGLLSLLLWLTWALRGDASERRRLLGLGACLVGANILAIGLFRVYVPGDQAEAEALLTFTRAFGLDVSTLVLPTEWLALPSVLGLTTDHSGLWGDGSSSAFNYIGLFSVLLALTYLISASLRGPAPALALAGLIALVLSLGPALKVSESREATSLDPPSSMPRGIATAELPWAPIFESTPGFDNMRASYRWSAVTRLALIVLAGLAVQQLLRHPNRRWARAGLALAVLAVLELAPNLPLLIDDAQKTYGHTVARRAVLDAGLQQATHPGERVFFLDHSEVHVNHFVVNDLVTAVGLTAYNTGGDKNAALALEHWPQEIAAIQDGDGSPAPMAHALESRAADVIVVPFFSLWRAVRAWPPSAQQRCEVQATLTPLATDPRLRVERFGWFATVRLERRLDRPDARPDSARLRQKARGAGAC